MNNTKKIFLNTGYLYAKVIITTLVSFYAVRLILKALGVIDFGIYNLVSGLISMLAFLNSAMTVASQRYISYNIGKGKKDKVRSIFKTSIFLHLCISIFLVLFLELLSYFLFDRLLNIPDDRINSAKTVYHLMVVSLFFTINAVPYDALIISHEDLYFDSLIGVFEVLVKLAISFYILEYIGDRLIAYSLLLTLLLIAVRIAKILFCRYNYKDIKSSFSLRIEKDTLKEMYQYAMWNTLGSIVIVGRNQAATIVLNLFFGTITNAAFAIATQINNYTLQFSSNLVKAMNPQIIKAEGEGYRDKMIELAFSASKYSVILLSIIAIPLVMEMQYVLDIWLDAPPENSILFCQLALISSIIMQYSTGLMSSVQAVGKIRKYTLTVSLFYLLNIPASIIFFYFDFPSYFIFVVIIVIEVFALGVRLYFAKNIVGLNINCFLNDVLFRSIFSILLTFAIVYSLSIVISPSFVRLLCVAMCSTVVLLGFSFFVVLKRKERDFVRALLDKIKGKL